MTNIKKILIDLNIVDIYSELNKIYNFHEFPNILRQDVKIVIKLHHDSNTCGEVNPTSIFDEYEFFGLKEPKTEIKKKNFKPSIITCLEDGNEQILNTIQTIKDISRPIRAKIYKIKDKIEEKYILV
jgi:hypothetical protein